jgi:DNA replicative helicase MCM subunit Mcm2 (Cdc46/Mcm family)
MKNSTDYMKAYYEKNKDKLKSYAITKKYCECCDKMVSRCNWNKHILRNSHIKNNELKELKKKTEMSDTETDEFIKTQAIKILEEYKKMMGGSPPPNPVLGGSPPPNPVLGGSPSTTSTDIAGNFVEVA